MRNQPAGSVVAEARGQGTETALVMESFQPYDPLRRRLFRSSLSLGGLVDNHYLSSCFCTRPCLED